MHHLIAHGEDIDFAAVEQAITAVPDQTVFSVGDDIRVPEFDQVVALAAGLALSAVGLAYITSPSLRSKGHMHVCPQNGGADADVEPDADECVTDLRLTPCQLKQGEALNAVMNGDTTAAAYQWMLTWLSNGPITQVTGKVQTIRLASATAMVARTWTTAPLVPQVDIEAGTYEIIGMRVHAASCIAGRLILRTTNWRPGVIGCDDDQDLPRSIFRHGRFGSFGTFDHDDPPQLEGLCDLADAAQIVHLDVVKVG